MPKSLARTANNKAHRERLKALVLEVKKDNPCALCGEVDPIVLEFHHPDPTNKWRSTRPNGKRGVSGLLVQGSKARLIEELEKCVLLCANCHLWVEAGVLSVEGLPLIKVKADA